MPRKRKTQGVKVPTGLPYGQGEQMADAQKALPLPGPGTRPQPQRAPAGPSPVPAAPVDPIAAAITAAQSMPPPPGGLLAPSTRNEPVTAGLNIGPGAGPEALPLQAFTDDDDTLLDLINAHKIAPSPALARLIQIARGRAQARQRTLTAGRQAQRGGF